MNTAETPPSCPECRKPAGLCVCATLEPVTTDITCVILQHPREQDEVLGTALMAHRMLPGSVLKTGLSWPGLAKILGQPVDMKAWGVLYLGTVAGGGAGTPLPLAAVDSKSGQPLPDQGNTLKGLEGIIVLDGTWAQAKTLWWRNPWLLKARRLILNPNHGSLYGGLRREPRKASLSTLEAVAFTLSRLENRPELYEQLTQPLKTFIEAFRLKNPTAAEKPAANRRRRPFRRKKRD
ncbi:MAG: DTW domain-containing protein [Pseudomonadota bacterium]|nr:DTW domain-containing protein [Pseudomonadota bacterium]